MQSVTTLQVYQHSLWGTGDKGELIKTSQERTGAVGRQ